MDMGRGPQRVGRAEKDMQVLAADIRKYAEVPQQH
jgi:hypothetical protein